MKVSIDKLGRIVLPKAVREAHGLTPGTELNLDSGDNKIVLSLPPPEGELIKRGRLLIFKHRNAPKIDAATARATLKKIRDERNDDLIRRSLKRAKKS